MPGHLPRVQPGTTNSSNEFVKQDINSDGAALTSSVITQDYRGLYPESWYLNGSDSGAATADNTVIYTSPDVSMYNCHTFENTSATDPMDIYVSLDGTNYLVTASAVMLHDATASTTFVLTIPAGDIGILNGRFKTIKVLKDGATAETPALRFSHSVK